MAVFTVEQAPGYWLIQVLEPMRTDDYRLGKGAQVYLGSAELAAVCALLGKIPTPEDYRKIAAEKIDPISSELYRYLNFDQIQGFEDQGRVMSPDEEAAVLAEA